MSDHSDTGAGTDGDTREAEALEWLLANRWSEDVIADVRASALGSRRLFPSDPGRLAGLTPRRPANHAVFAAVDALLHVAENAAGMARRHAGELLGVAVAPPPTTTTGGGTAAPASPGRPADEPVPVSQFPVRAAMRAGEARVSPSFVVENTTRHTLHTVRFKLRFLTAGQGADVPPGDVTFEPARFELLPREARTVTVHIRTADLKAGSYVGLAESGRFRQVIAIEVE